MTKRELELVYDVLVLAEYRYRVNDWAEGEPRELEDSAEDRAAARNYDRTLRKMQRALRVVRNELVRRAADRNLSR